MKSRSMCSFVFLAVAATAAGCSVTSERGWVPTAPGNIPETRQEPVAKSASPPRAAVAAAQPEKPKVSPFRASPSDPRPVAQPDASATAAAPAVPPNAGTYTQATRYGDLLFVSGQIGLDARNQLPAEKIEDQTRQALENIRVVLESHRLTMANIVSVTVYMKDLNQFRGMDETYETFFRGTLPARTVVAISHLPRGALVQISVVAGR